MGYHIISADDHIDMPWLPKDLWQRRVPARWRERAPKVIHPTATALRLADMDRDGSTRR